MSITILSVILTCALLVPPAGGVEAAPAQQTAASQPLASTASAAAPARVAEKKKKAKYRVKRGVTFNSALGNVNKKRAIIRKINSAIAHTGKGQRIRIFSWKVWTYAGVTALLKAQKRGVKVQVLMDKKNTVVENNPHFWRLRKGLKQGNKHRAKDRRSSARLCNHSCRGKGGAAHSKFMLFSKAGRSRYVYMNSSANWGDAAANLQWNDMYTFVGDRGIYDAAVATFDQAWKDKPVKGPWTEYSSHKGSIVVAWSPTDSKSRKSDRLLQTLRKVKCRGATGGAGNRNGRTMIRTAPDVIRGDRGMAVGKQLRRLWDNGCDVKIGYTVMGKDVSRMLRSSGGRGPVPLRHLTQDFDGDGIFDRYFHLKAYTINGVIGRDKQAFWMVSGSSNTCRLSLVSDEAFVYFIDRPGITKRYQNHINYWFDHFPESEPTSRAAARRVADGSVDPYAKMELD
jgi:phosphatidylserine/phosphatidylglycerophosphate/cardiolipin synthase-like enzyme